MAAVHAPEPSDVEPVIDKKPTLTPPLSDKKSKLDNDTSSELSELDELDDIGDIEPDHYYGDGKIPIFKPVSLPDHIA